MVRAATFLSHHTHTAPHSQYHSHRQKRTLQQPARRTPAELNQAARTASPLLFLHSSCPILRPTMKECLLLFKLFPALPPSLPASSSTSSVHTLVALLLGLVTDAQTRKERGLQVRREKEGEEGREGGREGGREEEVCMRNHDPCYCHGSWFQKERKVEMDG